MVCFLHCNGAHEKNLLNVYEDLTKWRDWHLNRETEVQQQEMACFDDVIGCMVRLVEICHPEEGEK